MKPIRSVVFGVLALSVLAAKRPAASHRAWPWFMLIRGGGLEKSVVITRPVSVSSTSALDRRPTSIPGDIVALYSSLTTSATIPADYRTLLRGGRVLGAGLDTADEPKGPAGAHIRERRHLVSSSPRPSEESPVSAFEVLPRDASTIAEREWNESNE